MSEMKKQPDQNETPATAAESTPQKTMPATEIGVTQPGPEAEAKPQTAVPSPAVPSVTPPDPQAIEEWNRQVRRRMSRQTRRGFIGLGAGMLAGLGAFEWFTSRRMINGIPWPFRKTLEVNEQLAHDYLTTGRLAPTFPPDRISEDRVNGDVGLDDDVDAAAWKLQVEGLAAGDEPLKLDLDAIKKLPRMEMVTEFKCIEGWSVIVQWAGARFTDFMRAFPPQTRSGNEFSLNHADDLPAYVSMETPDGEYFVGLDTESVLHPQTMLCYERNGEPLSQDHGAPLRLVIPVKYGVKNLKRIGTIRYTELRPADYWAERGYDWYIGL
ncbi:MAG TPA: molybdopterin-dependent oxidoreductase [Terriglobia bacterium]|nr:molybdopterin-dependent oxidoreductase [Terriglobia bacterium]